MHTFTFLPRHRRYAQLADAFVDGELRGGALRRFEVHLASCDRCEASVAAARTQKAGVAGLPGYSAPRSFQLTPAMVATPATEKSRRASGTPLYLGLARAGAALSVGAFATVLAVTAFDSDGGKSAEEATASGEFRADAAAPVEAASGTATDTDTFSATPEATSPIAPATTGSAAGAGVPTATASGEPRVPATGQGAGLDLATPVPPSTGRDPASPVPQDTTRNGVIESPVAGNPKSLETFESVPGGVLIEPYNPSLATNDADDASPWLLRLGILAAATVGVLGVMEVSRRARK